MPAKKAKKKVAKKKVAKKKALTPAQKVFVAAKAAGYGAGDAAGEAGLAHPPRGRHIDEAVAKAVTEKLKILGIQADDVIRRLAQIAFADLTDVVHIDGEVGGVRFHPTVEWGEQHKASVNKIKQTKDGIEVQFTDRLKALEILAKHFGVLDDRPQVNVDNLVVVPAKIGDMGEWEKHAKEAREQSLTRMQDKIG